VGRTPRNSGSAPCFQENDEVRAGSKAALTAPKSDFRITPESRLKSDIVWVATCIRAKTIGIGHASRQPIQIEPRRCIDRRHRCERLMSVPGIGPIISSAMVAAIGAGDVFTKGRDFAAWLGLVPKQISTGDRTILGKISRRGNRYLRVLFVRAAWVVLIKPTVWERHGLKPWIEAARKRLHHNVLAVALANKLARIALERLGPWPGLRGAEDRPDSEPIRLIPIPRQRQHRGRKMRSPR
jgi:hypothetical protein